VSELRLRVHKAGFQPVWPVCTMRSRRPVGNVMIS